MTLTKPQLTKAKKTYEIYWESYINGDLETFASTLDENFEMIGTSESEVAHNKAEGIAFYKAQMEEVVGKVDMRNRQISTKPLGDLVLINETCDIYVLDKPDLSADRQNGRFYSKIRISTLLYETENGWKVIQQHGSLPDMLVQEGETLALEKITKENLELRDAVRRRTIELENKSRELEIEAALERVRAQTMAMNSSEDVGKCIVRMFAELTALGVDEGTRFGIGILNPDNEINQLWTARKDGQEVKMHIGNLDMNAHPLLKRAYKAWQEQVPFHQYILEGEDLLAYYQMLNNAPDYKIQIPIEKLPKREVQHCFIFEHGFFYAFSPREFQPELIEIIHRFSSQFAQTYRRYLDLVKAETQAKEAKIEAALERVRSRSLGMHYSSELSAVVDTLLQEFTNLEFTLTFCIINLIDGDDLSNTVWAANPETGKDAESYYMKFEDYPFHYAMWDAWKAQDKRFVYTLEGEEKKIYDDYLYSDTEFRRFPKHVQEANKALERYVAGFTFFKYSGLQTVSVNEISEADLEILERFGKVFEQAYTRFLDLQKAEVQAREARIEAALEKVRSRSLAMHKSVELKEVIQVVHDQLIQLNIPVDHAGFIIDYKNREDMHIWLADHQQGVPSEITFPYFDSPHWNSYREAKANGDNFFANLLPFEVKNKFYQDLFELIPDLTEEAKQTIFNKPALVISTVLLDNVGLYIEHYSETPFTAEENNILMRFGKVFQQTYTRFLDLQKAEAQAREGQIQLALERVRMVALGLNRSEEMLEVAKALYEQLLELGFSNMRNAIIDINNGDGDTFTDYDYSHEMSGTITQMSYHDDPTLEGQFKMMAVTTNDFFELILKGKELEDLKKMRINNGEAPDPRLDKIEELTYNLYSFGNGAIGISNFGVLSEVEKTVLNRFSNVFTFAYKRYTDLASAEAQAKETEIELALERVRARTMAMQHSDELTEASEVLDQQVRALGIETWGCAFHIYADDPEGDGEWFSSREGRLPFYKTPREEFFLKFYKKGQAGAGFHVEEFLGDDCKTHYDYLMTIPVMGDALRAVLAAGGSLPESQYDHIAFFKHGYILFITYEPVPEAHAIFQRFAKVFEQTYTRFLDLQKAEAQAREAQIETALEKVRSRSLAMHNSDELNEVVKVLFEKMTELKVPSTAVGIQTFTEDSKDVQCFVCGDVGTGIVISQYQLPYFDHPIIHDYHEVREKNLDLYVGTYSKKVKDSFYDVVLKLPELKNLQAEVKTMIRGSAVYKITMVPAKKSVLAVNDFYGNPLSESQLTILKRFAKVFDQAYTRFLDLQKAEAQAREAKIETALEKVRSRTMGMQSSDELPEVANLLFLEVQALGIPAWSCGHNVLAADKKSATAWMSSEGTLQTPFTLRLWGEASFDEMGEFILSNDVFMEQELGGKALIEHYTHMKSFPDLKPTFDQIEAMGLSLPTFQINHLCKFSHGFLLFITYEPVPDAHDIFLRFTKVFDQTYTRFLDLQKAEAQAREAKIEVALEKVRSRTMGMQKSDELADVANVLFQEMNDLVHNLWTCGFVLCEKDRTEDEWWLSLEDGFSRGFFLPNINDYAHAHLYEGWLKRDDFRSVQLEGDDLQAHYDWLMEIPVAKNIFDDMEAAGMQRPEWQKLHAAYFSKGYLVIITREPCPEEAIFKRFAQVFDLTYTRFLDLQKAEEQAREAKIEAALERVRARSMGMQKSEELIKVVRQIGQELKEMDIDVHNSQIWSDFSTDPTDGLNLWVDVPGQSYLEKFHIPFVDQPITLNFFDALKGLDYFSDKYSKEVKDQYFKFLFKESDFKRVPQERKDFIMNAPGWVRFTVILKESCLHFGRFNLDDFTDEEKDIFKRIGKVFGQAYTRFLDLQKAEGQAREALIGNALEKVRSRSLAMQSPDELVEVAQLLREEMGALGVEELETSSIYIHDDSSRLTECWFTIKDSKNPIKTVSDQMNLDLKDTWVGRQMLDFYQSDQDRTSILMQGEQRVQWIHYCEDKSELLGKSEFYGETIPERMYHIYKFSNGFLGAASPGSISEESWDLLRRATGVFSFAYTRFQDLQVAQASAQAAKRQASLDRVRADISSMRSAADLELITPLIFRELTILGVPFIRCGVFIIQEKEEIIEAYLSSPDGNSLGVLRLPYQASALTYQTVEAWRKGLVYRQHWNKEDFVQWIEQLMQQDQIQDSSTYQGSAAPPESLDLHFVPFTQGMLYVGSTAPLGEEEIDLVKSLAEAFSIAFARYEDFVKLEQAKAEVESAMSELKATQSQLVQQEKLASLGQLTAGIAHEIKNPLNFINNFSEVNLELVDEIREERAKSLEERDETLVDEILEDIRSNLEKVHEHGSRADRIVKSMLQHSRSGDNKKALKPLNPIIKEFVNLAYHGMRAGKAPINVEIELQLGEEVGEVELISEDFSRVVLNLCNNAFDAMREKIIKTEDRRQKTGDKSIKYEPRLTVSTKLENGNVLISIEDNGPGIPEEIKDKILQPFFTTKKGTEGTGLGLSITNDIIKAHGGELDIQSIPGSTIFKILLTH